MAAQEVTNAFTVLGSPRYMAPEQLRNSKDVDRRADLWSLGAVLFQLLTGRHAFDADHSVHASLAVLTLEPPLVRSLAPHVPAELEAVVYKCLTKDRDGRFQTAEELADALRPFASDHTRESLEQLLAAKQGPSVDIGLGVASEGARVDPHRPPSTSAMKLAIAGGGLLAVLLAFGLLTLLKMAAQTVGVMPTVASEEPSLPPRAASSAPSGGAELPSGLAPPSQVVTVTLDAGRTPP